jgi:regulator of sigma E protease
VEIFITIIAFLGVLAVLIIAHELGHLTTAKLAGVTVEEFGIGFPPRLLFFRRGGTIYSLNAIPLGGFVKMVGEEDPKVAGSLASKSIPVRLLALGSGSLMNLLLPLLLFSVAFMVPHNVVYGQVQIDEVAANSPAARAGIVSGDIILEINDNKVNNIGDLQRHIQLSMLMALPRRSGRCRDGGHLKKRGRLAWPLESSRRRLSGRVFPSGRRYRWACKNALKLLFCSRTASSA